MMLDKSMQSMAKMVDSLADARNKFNVASTYFKRNYSFWLDTVKFNNFYDAKPQTTSKELPEEFSKNIFISDVNFVWDDVVNSYRSVGKIGIGCIAKKQINKYVDGYIEIYRKRSGDNFDIYLQIDDKTFYYFGYTRGTMQVISSDNLNFNQPIRDLKDADRAMKIEHNQMPYTFLVSTERKMGLFKKRWQAFVQGAEQPQEKGKQEDENDDQKPQENGHQPDDNNK